MPNVTVIGGGPAGMMAAIKAAEAGADVTLLEKNEKLGKKLYITGKGRCNLTNACDTEEFFDSVVTNKKFLYSALYNFSPKDTVDFFESAGLKLKVERGKRVFPASDKSSDVIKALERELKKRGVRIKLNCKVKSLDDIMADAIVIATGGLSYPQTGSTGDGYGFARAAGHKVTETSPSLAAFYVSENFVKDLEGLSLKNISVKIKDAKGKTCFEDFGEMLFTSDGISGPVILTASAFLGRKINESPGAYKIYIDLKPALDAEMMNRRILKDFEENINREFKNSLNRLLPSKMIGTVIALSGIPEDKRVNLITRNERQRLALLLKAFPLTLTGTEGYDRAVVTQGGINVKEVNPSTMESKIHPGIFFAGEILDVDALTGGFNIQIALSTGALAGESAALPKRGRQPLIINC